MKEKLMYLCRFHNHQSYSSALAYENNEKNHLIPYLPEGIFYTDDQFIDTLNILDTYEDIGFFV